MRASLLFLTSDASILDMMRKGNDEALVALYHSNRRPVTAYVTRNNGTEDDAEDLLQEALVVLWERVRSGRYEYSAKLSTFIFATVKNMWMRRLARKSREEPLDPGRRDHADTAFGALEQLILSEETRIVRDALEQLGEPCRQLLLLFYWEENSMEQIASKLGFANADTVKSKKYQCKKSLEQLVMQMQ